MTRDEVKCGETAYDETADAAGEAWVWDDDPWWPEEGETIGEMWGLFRSASEFHGRSGWFEGARLLALALDAGLLVPVAEDLVGGLTDEERDGLLRGASVTRRWGDPDLEGDGGSSSLRVHRLRMPAPLPSWLRDWGEGRL